ncbi:MAG: hypothetical protein ABSA02_42065 [Trebonia sp.]
MHTEGIWLRFLSGPDIESLGISRAEIIDAVAEVITAHGRGRTVFEPRGESHRTNASCSGIAGCRSWISPWHI